MTDTQIIKQNSKYQITFTPHYGYFIEFKNSFGRWVIVRSMKESEIERVWQKAEEAEKFYQVA